jgi:hypothetical protein
MIHRKSFIPMNTPKCIPQLLAPVPRQRSFATCAFWDPPFLRWKRGSGGGGRFIVAMLGFIITSTLLEAQPTAFTYQGLLVDQGQVATGNYELQFSIFDALTGGSVLGPTNTFGPVAVSNGLFTVTLDFGSGIFDGANRWLETGVRPAGSVTPFTILSPRQAITSAPYAMFAGRATFAGTATNLAAGGLISGDGAGLTNLNGGSIQAGTIMSNQIDSTTDAAYRAGAISQDPHLVSIAAFGAVGGDVARDSAALAAAFQSVTNSGGVLYIPAGVFLVTNNLVITADPVLYTTWLGSSVVAKFRIRGAGSAVSVLKFVGTNSALIESGFALEVSDLGIRNAGSGTNAAIRTNKGPNGNTGLSCLINVTITDFDLGAEMIGGGGYAYGCAFRNNRIGMRIPGSSNGWTVDARFDGNTVGIEVGGATGIPAFGSIKNANGARIHLTGSHNGYAAVIGHCEGTDLSGTQESCTNAYFAIGHPPALFPNDIDTTVGNVHIHNFSSLMQAPAGSAPGTFFAGVQVFAPPEGLHVTDCRLDPVLIMTNTADASTYTFEKVQACLLIDSTGHTNSFTYNPGSLVGTGSSTFNPDPINARYAGSTASGPLKSVGGYAALGGSFSGNGAGITNIPAPSVSFNFGSGLAAVTNGSTITVSALAFPNGLTTNLLIPAVGGGTNQLQFTQGILTGVLHTGP